MLSQASPYSSNLSSQQCSKGDGGMIYFHSGLEDFELNASLCLVKRIPLNCVLFSYCKLCLKNVQADAIVCWPMLLFVDATLSFYLWTVTKWVTTDLIIIGKCRMPSGQVEWRSGNTWSWMRQTEDRELWHLPEEAFIEQDIAIGIWRWR